MIAQDFISSVFQILVINISIVPCQELQSTFLNVVLNVEECDLACQSLGGRGTGDLKFILIQPQF